MLRSTALRTLPRIRCLSTMPASKISDAIMNDHREIKEYYTNIRNASSTDEKTRWRNQFVWELARHSVGEELVVYPAFEKHVNGGKEMAEKDREEHQVVKDLLYEIQDMSVTKSEFEPLLEKLMTNLNQHIDEEESHDLPALEKAISASDSESMANSFGRTKMLVPTRSHPSAPAKPPFETIAGLFAAPMDRLGDLLRKFPDK